MTPARQSHPHSFVGWLEGALCSSIVLGIIGYAIWKFFCALRSDLKGHFRKPGANASWDDRLKDKYQNLKNDGLVSRTDCRKIDALLIELDAAKTTEEADKTRLKLFKAISICWVKQSHHLKEPNLDVIRTWFRWNRLKKRLIEKINAATTLEESNLVSREINWLHIKASNKGFMGDPFAETAEGRKSTNQLIEEYNERIRKAEKGEGMIGAVHNVYKALGVNTKSLPRDRLPFNLWITRKSPNYDKVLALESRMREEAKIAVQSVLNEKLQRMSKFKRRTEEPRLRREVENEVVLEKLHAAMNSDPGIEMLINDALADSGD